MLRAIIGIGLMLLLPAAVADEEACGAREGTTARVLCHAERAVAEGSRAPCERAADRRVRDQCYGVYAVRTGDAPSCRAIPGDGPRAAGLRQICLSDVAIVTGNGDLCREIADTGLRDACHLKLARDTGRTGLCERIEQPALRRLCRR